MLVIREKQMQSMKVENDRDFVEAAYEELQKNFSSSLGAATLEEAAPRIEEAKERSHRYGLPASADVMAFIALSFVISPTFDEYSPIQERLTSPSIPDHRRMERLFDEVTEKEWQLASSENQSKSLYSNNGA